MTNADKLITKLSKGYSLPIVSGNIIIYISKLENRIAKLEEQIKIINIKG